MVDIFKEQRFYPSEDVPVVEHYKGNFESVFLAFVPFFRIDESRLTKTSFQKVHQITYPQFKAANPDLPIPESAGHFYWNDNPDYPEDEEIQKFGKSVTWKEVRSGGNFDSFAEINKALRTSIGGYRTVFERKDLADRLLKYANDERVFLPEEGKFDVFSKIAILEAFRKLTKESVIVENEYLTAKETIEITSITPEKFCESITHKDYYLYDAQNELLFSIDWDFCYFFICSSRANIDEILVDGAFEGVYCDKNTQLPWETTDEEMRTALAKEASEAKLRSLM